MGGRSTIWGSLVLFCSGVLLATAACEASPLEGVARLADGGASDAISPADLFVRDDCARAIATQCATPFAYCTADATCGRALTCLASCAQLPCDCDQRLDLRSTVSVARYASALDCLTNAQNTLTECPESDALTSPLLNQVCPPAPPQEDACTQCLEQTCCESRKAQRESPDAIAVRECEIGCGPISSPEVDACVLDCYRAAPEASLIWRRLVACGTVRCGAPCTAAPLNKCLACNLRRCGDSFAETRLVADGSATMGCVGRCNNSPSCISACLKDASPEAQNATGAFNLCSNSRCAAACAQ